MIEIYEGFIEKNKLNKLEINYDKFNELEEKLKNLRIKKNELKK
jgi:hypothetical protein